LKINCDKEDFLLSWSKEGLEEFYNSYTIEYSTDGGVSFSAMNDYPFVYFVTDDLDPSLQNIIVYHDKLDVEVDEYLFRVVGHTSFGETGPPSATIAGASVPDPILVFPRISEITELESGSFRLEWTVNETVSDSIMSFNMLRYDSFPGVPDTLNTAPLSGQQRNYVDEQAQDFQFYQLEAIDIFGYAHTSATVVGRRIDSIPPLPPTGLVGSIDSLTDTTALVTVTWSPNSEQDLSGYHIYQANGAEQVFTCLNPDDLLVDTIFQDTITNQVLADYLYFKVRAFDFRGNRSELSEVLRLARPDVIPPTPPVLNLQTSGDEQELSWVNSSSSDVSAYRIERRDIGSTEWLVLETAAPKS
ncbi:MAG: hypothetical protein AAGA62_18660, partial [Bacteroidota bacterium]